MAIKPPNYTQIPNIFFDQYLKDLGHAETKVILAIYRKTFGWHKEREEISLSQIHEITGLKREHIIKASKSLEEKNMIKKVVSGKNGDKKTTYFLVFLEDQNISTSPAKGPELVPQRDYPLVPQRDIQKKEIKKDKENNPLPPKGDVRSASAEASELAEFLKTSIESYLPGFIPKNLSSWAHDFDKMIKLDKRDPSAIKRLIEWIKGNEFWKANILSVKKLREKFDQITLKMQSEQQAKPKNKTEQQEAYQRESKSKEQVNRECQARYPEVVKKFNLGKKNDQRKMYGEALLYPDYLKLVVYERPNGQRREEYKINYSEYFLESLERQLQSLGFQMR